MKNYLSICLMLLPFILYSQKNNINVLEVGKQIRTNEITEVKKLVQKLVPTVYFNNNKVNLKTSEPVLKIVTDIQSLDLIAKNREDYKNVKIIIIKISSKSSLKSQIDFNVFEEFKNLKYIFINSEVEISKSSLIKMCKNRPSKIIFTYSINIPS